MKQRLSKIAESFRALSPSRACAKWTVFTPALLLFCLGGISDIMLPGVYMDAVNPDYTIVHLLNPGTNVPVWMLPGTFLFGLFPVLGQIYHGALPFYVGLPIYALFGTGILGIRLANLLFGLIVLVAAGVFLRTFRVRPVIASLTLAALALDPGFLFSFRTQFYITLLPCALILLAVALVEERREALTPRVAAAAGFLAGLSVYGYFIYVFLLPIAALHALWRWRGNLGRPNVLLWWIGGLALGGSPYILGVLLILIATGGLHDFLHFISVNLSTLEVAQSPLSLRQRAGYFVSMVSWTVLDVGPAAMMLHKSVPLFLPNTKFVLLLIIPALGLVAGLTRRLRSPGLVIAVGFFLGTAGLVGVFGNRVWLHHMALLVPVMYIAMALTLEQLATYCVRYSVILTIAIVPILPLLVGNAVDQQSVLFDLTQTGGVGLASDAIERFAEDSLQTPVPTHAFFPDWGVFMPFEMITRGQIPLTTGFTPLEAQRTLCAGRDVLLGLMDNSIAVGQPGSDRLPAWIKAVGWGQPDLATYRQRDQVPVITAIRWHASASPHPACPPS
jgi:hypothetical protein